jgi:hypothetical protein
MKTLHLSWFCSLIHGRWAGDLAFGISEDQAGYNQFLVSRPCHILNLPDLFGYLDFI